jgi:hypothetical protein
MDFERLEDNTTLVKISEAGCISKDQPSLDESYSNCQGWTNDLLFKGIS